MAEELVFGRSEAFQKIIEIADRYAQSYWPVLLMGETGVGKELIARRIHNRSARSQGPFVPINCSALPADLFESELFGHHRGSFSGAMQHSKGLFRHAEGGTVLLDEIGELALPLQVKLLRAIESGEIRSVGSQEIEHINIRFIAATNANLHHCARQSRFRLDLLERLSVLTLMVPPLRERKQDISLICAYLLSQFGTSCDPITLKTLEHFQWPGNVRQLRNVLARASVLSPELITPSCLQQVLEEENLLSGMMMAGTESFSGDITLEEYEKRVIIAMLKKHRGSRKDTALALGIAKSTLHEKLRRWRQDPSSTYPIYRYSPGAE